MKPSLARRARSTFFIMLRAVFRALPMSESRRDAVRSRLLRSFPTIRPLAAQGEPATSYERRPRVRADERFIGYVEYSEEPLPDPLPATLVAFYLPQFHTIPENDKWWGKGFTEWRNVTRALPQFEGHLQPRLPGDLGFYDLRNPQVMRDQAKLAKTYGLSAFCFYFYWFGGKTLLEMPLRNWLNDRSIDFQYCLCWANENWTRRWDGRDDDVLIAQKHSPDDDIAFIEYVADYLRDSRYLRVDGKPMLLLYRPMLLPDPKATAERWRAWCRENAVGEIHLAYVQSFERPDPLEIGFDAAVEFPPNLGHVVEIAGEACIVNPAYSGQIADWRAMADGFASRTVPAYRLHRGVNCGWDNEPRRPGGGRVWRHSTAGGYGEWLHSVITKAKDGSHPVFINAWNEWAEGAVLEPDAHAGYAYLHASRRALRIAGHRGVTRPCIVIHAWYPDTLEEIRDALKRAKVDGRLVITAPHERMDAIRRVVGERAELIATPNRGRDVLPFLRVAKRLRDEGEQLILKLHTKQSHHLPHGADWRRELIDDLLSPSNAGRILTAFAANERLGLIAPRDHVRPLQRFQGANAERVEQLRRLVGIDDAHLQNAFFIAGTMFWARTAALAPLLDADLFESDFEEEAGQLDGTMAHAIERLFGVTAFAAGFDLLCSDLSPPGPERAAYAYAAPTDPQA